MKAAKINANPPASAYLPAFRDARMDEDASDAERRAEMTRAATNRVAAKRLGIHARTGLKMLRTTKQATSSADRLLFIQVAALKRRV